ncbi:MAG: hypothetical protein IJP78_12625 [Clostridia bacterium]|nr:hypothetical protein [Clostridia bacterium]
MKRHPPFCLVPDQEKRKRHALRDARRVHAQFLSPVLRFPYLINFHARLQIKLPEAPIIFSYGSAKFGAQMQNHGPRSGKNQIITDDPHKKFNAARILLGTRRGIFARFKTKAEGIFSLRRPYITTFWVKFQALYSV